MGSWPSPCLFGQGIFHHGPPPPRSLQDPRVAMVQTLSPRTLLGRRDEKG